MIYTFNNNMIKYISLFVLSMGLSTAQNLT
jgi:hypothetical protein